MLLSGSLAPAPREADGGVVRCGGFFGGDSGASESLSTTVFRLVARFGRSVAGMAAPEPSASIRGKLTEAGGSYEAEVATSRLV